MRAKSILTVAAIPLAVTLGTGTRYTEARAQVTESSVAYAWKDVNGKCPATCDTSQYACPCKVATYDEPEFY